jgi:hypothetical protein
MRDINPAERLLSLFTSPESAAGVVGDLSEERGQRGSMWFWRQVMGTAFSLCRGTWFASPGAVLLLVLFGLALEVGLSSVWVRLIDLQNLSSIQYFRFIQYSQLLVIGAVLVATAPRLGMAACVMLAAITDLLSLFTISWAYLNWDYPMHWSALGSVIIGLLASPLTLCLGGAIFRRRWTLRHPRKVA